jgi:hypothetical protein
MTSIMLRTARLVATALLLGSTMPLEQAHAQIRASELQTVAQTVDGTTVTLTYSRPRLRGRSNIWGTRVVRWGEVWTPGANDATTLQVDHDITVSGVKVPKGKYSVWMVVSKDSTWTMLLDPKWKQFHEDHPKPNDTQIHVPVSANHQASTVEDALTWSFPSVTARGGTMAMQWERMRVTAPFAVTPTLSETMPEAEARPYTGTYVLTDPKSGQDSGQLVVTYERGGLKGRFVPEDNYLQTFALMKVGPDIFTIGLYMRAEVYADGEVYEVLKPDFMLTFTRKGSSMTVEARGADDGLFFTGRK